MPMQKARRRRRRVAACGGRSRPRCDSLLWESGLVRDTTDVKRRVMTQPLVVRNHKPLHGWFATALFLAGALASSGVAAAIGEQFCTHGGQDPQKGDSVACYSDAGCRFAASLKIIVIVTTGDSNTAALLQATAPCRSCLPWCLIRLGPALLRASHDPEATPLGS